jgi:SAM-dependent methyltransferase
VAAGDREHWDARYRAGEHASDPAPDWLGELDELDAHWKPGGRALDVAAGAGRVARWLAGRGLQVLAVDVSAVALQMAREAARGHGLEIETLERDLELEPLPPGPFEVISCFHYLQRSLFGPMRERLAPGGLLICEIATVRNLERHARPSARFLLQPNELLALCAPLEVVYYREGWLGDRSLARIVASRVR